MIRSIFEMNKQIHAINAKKKDKTSELGMGFVSWLDKKSTMKPSAVTEISGVEFMITLPRLVNKLKSESFSFHPLQVLNEKF